VHLGLDPDFQPAAEVHPAFVVDDVRALAAHLTRAGAQVVDDEPRDRFDRIYALDPFGNRIELLQPRRSTFDASRARGHTQCRTRRYWIFQTLSMSSL
jgi:hypothetical protein